MPFSATSVSSTSILTGFGAQPSTSGTVSATTNLNPFISTIGIQQPTFIQPTFTLPPIIGPLIPQLPPTPVQPPAPASPTASASDLQVMISAIPIAQDGHVITADFHNALRLALVAIANRMGIGPVTQEITVSNAPRLFPVAGMALWDHEYGIVKRPSTLQPDSATIIGGWMEMELPDGARIKKMSVFGTVTGGGDGALTIKLKRQRIVNPSSPVDLIAIKVPDGNDATKGLDGDVTGGDTGIGPNGIEELRIVNNREQKYLLAVELKVAATAGQLNAIQVVLGQ